MAGKPTPEEQLLRLIEGDKGSSASLKTPVGETPFRKSKTASHPLSKKLQHTLKFLTPATLNIKLINRLLTVITIGLLVYLVLEITQNQAVSEEAEMVKQLRGGITAIKMAEFPLPTDLIDYEERIKKRNIFKPVVKEQPAPAVITPTQPSPPVVVQPTPPIIVMTDPMIEELKKKYKLVGVISVAGKTNVIIEKDKGEVAYTLGVNDTGIKGALNFGGGEIKYSLKVKEIKEDTVILVDEISNKEMELNLNQ